MTPVVTKIDANGRLSIPATHRKALGLEQGGPVVVAVEGDEVRIRSAARVMAELQAGAARFLSHAGASVEAFIAQRRADARREEDEERGEAPGTVQGGTDVE
jgi:AbrB family looped-hinge helix DNA binding protein